MKKISVILTTYNSEKDIDKTVQSILNQDGVNEEFSIELIVIDDCSTDETYSVLESLNCILMKNEKNSGGPNKGRNKGLEIATGDFICIADQDDIWKSDKIKSLLKYSEMAAIISSGYELIDKRANRTVQRVCDSKDDYIFYDKNETFIQNLKKSTKKQNAYLGSILYDSSLKDIRFEEEYGAVDYDWILRLFHQQTSIEICKMLYTRIVDGNNLSLNEGYRMKDYTYSLKFFETYRQAYPTEVKLGIERLNGSIARYYYLMGNMKQARHYFKKSKLEIKTLLYYLTSYCGSGFVKKYFQVFG